MHKTIATNLSVNSAVGENEWIAFALGFSMCVTGLDTLELKIKLWKFHGNVLPNPRAGKR